MKKILTVLTISSVLALSGCSDANKAHSTLSAAGYTNVLTEGWTPFACAEDDVFTTQFTAVNTNGKDVAGVVCSGWFKGGTIRF